MILFYQPRIDEGALFLDEEESRHCAKVLRKAVGETIKITDGKGRFYDAVITKADPRSCVFSIVSQTNQPARDFHIHLAISPTKNADRIEWLIEKCVEVGIDEISLVECKHTERAYLKMDRLVKVAISAMKQSLKATLPTINSMQPLSSFVAARSESSKFIAYVDSENPLTLKDAAKGFLKAVVLIGPEGDFSKEELDMALDNGFHKVSLGPSRLRTETAGLAACMTLNLEKL